MNRAPRLKSQGYTLLEIMLVMVIAAVIVITAVVAYQRYNDRQQAERVAQLSGVMINNIRQQFQTFDNCSATANGYCGTYSGAGNMTAYFLQSGIVPNELLNNPVNPTATKTPWGGTISFTPSTLNGNANSGLDIGFSGVPATVCINMVTDMAGNVQKISVNGTIVKDITPAQGSSGTISTVNMTNLTTKCTSNSTVTMTLDSGSAYSTGQGNTTLPADNGYTGPMTTYRVLCPIYDVNGNPTGQTQACFSAATLAAATSTNLATSQNAACIQGSNYQSTACTTPPTPPCTTRATCTAHYVANNPTASNATQQTLPTSTVSKNQPAYNPPAVH